MARKKSTSSEHAKTVLKKPRGTFKNELLERIEIGEDLYDRPLSDWEELAKLSKEGYDWNDFNKELIKRAFNNHSSEYLNEYSKLNIASGLADYMRTNDFSNASQLMPGIPQQTQRILDAVHHDSLDEKVLDANIERILNIILRSAVFKGYKHSDKPDLKKDALVSRMAAEYSVI